MIPFRSAYKRIIAAKRKRRKPPKLIEVGPGPTAAERAQGRVALRAAEALSRRREKGAGRVGGEARAPARKQPGRVEMWRGLALPAASVAVFNTTEGAINFSQG